MYRLYIDYCIDNCHLVSERMYRHIFNTNFNISFFKPKKDQCSQCNVYYAAEGATKERLMSDWTAHKAREDQAMKMKEADKLKACEDPTFETVSFDLRAVICTPHAGDAQIYYKRKLSVYNFTIYQPSTNDGFCYVWDESEGGRGSCEIGTCLLEYIKALPKEITHLSTFSDTCGGQNRNQFILATMLYAIQNDDNNLQTTDMKYMERGHSYLEADSMHACIEREKRHRKVYTTEGWQLLISLARKDKQAYC